MKEKLNYEYNTLKPNINSYWLQECINFVYYNENKTKYIQQTVNVTYSNSNERNSSKFHCCLS